MKSLTKIALAAALALGAAAPALALTATLNVPGGINFGTVTYNNSTYDIDPTAAVNNVSGVLVDVLLSGGYNFVDTGSHSAFGYNLNAPNTTGGIVEITPSGTNTYTYANYLAGGTAQSGFGTFTNLVTCFGSAGQTPVGCQGGNNLNTPNNQITFFVSGVSTSNFVANSAGYLFTADLYGPGVNGTRATFPVGSGVPAIPEPETYALMLAGLAAVGFMARRRRQA